MTRDDLLALVDDAPPETLPALIKDLEAAKAEALARLAPDDDAPSAKGLFSLMIVLVVMLVVYLVGIGLVIRARS